MLLDGPAHRDQAQQTQALSTTSEVITSGAAGRRPKDMSMMHFEIGEKPCLQRNCPFGASG